MRRGEFSIFLAFICMTGLASWPRAVAAPVNSQEGTPEMEVPETVYAATPQLVVNLMLELADVKQTDLLYDLGCGDGRIAITAARRYGCHALGVDIDPDRVRESQANVEQADLEDLVTIEQQDIFDLDLSQADVVAFYLLPELAIKLIPQLEKMKPGARVVSYQFDLYGIEPDTVVTMSSRLHGEHKIFLWTLPLHRMLAPDGRGDAAQRPQFNAFLIYVVSSVAVAALGLAAFLWLLRKRLGVVKINVTVDRGGRGDG